MRSGSAGSLSSCLIQADHYPLGCPVKRDREFPPVHEAGAGCGKAARTDLCGGREVTRIPTANAQLRWEVAEMHVHALHDGRLRSRLQTELAKHMSC
jgi:hypothetical protein